MPSVRSRQQTVQGSICAHASQYSPMFPHQHPLGPSADGHLVVPRGRWEEGEEGTRELALGSQQSPIHPLPPPPTSILPSGLVLITEGWQSTPPTHTSCRGWGPRGLELGQRHKSRRHRSTEMERDPWPETDDRRQKAFPGLSR